MEIVHIVLGKANPDRMNGVNKVVYQLATHQAILGRHVSVWGITKDTTSNYPERKFRTQLYKACKNPFRIDDKLKSDLLKQRGSVTVHLHGGWIPAFSTLAKFMRENKIPYVLTPHGAYNTIAMLKSRIVKRIYFSLFERQLLQGARKIHCLGESEITGVKSMIHLDNCKLLPYGFEMVTNSSVNGHDQDKGQSFIIGFVGRLDIHTKGLDLLLKAFKQFQSMKENTNASIWIVGDGQERGKLEKMIIEKDLDKVVVLYGSKFGEEKNELLQKMDVFVHPSRNEGLPSAVLEAASFGIPCIVSKATNVGHYIESFNAGIQIENENVNELLAAMVNLSNMKRNSELYKLKMNAKRMIDETFNWSHIVKQFDTLYQE